MRSGTVSRQNRVVKIRLHSAEGPAVDLAGIRGHDREALCRALESVDVGSGDQRRVLWQQERSSAAVRNAARLVFGLGWVAAVGLAIAAVFVGPSALVALGLLVVVGGGFVAAVWCRDVGVSVHEDGTVRRAGWGGVAEFRLENFDRAEVID